MLNQERWKTQKTYEWPDNYYMEKDSMKRRGLLNEQMQEEPSKTNQLRLCLWEKRYLDEKGICTNIDYYLKSWNEMNFILRQKDSFFGKKTFLKSLKNIRNIYGFDLLKENPDYEEVWYDEYMNFCCFYIQISITDKSYTNVLFNIGKMPEGSLIVKLAEDLCRQTIEIPEILGISEDFKLMAKAAENSFGLFYPEKTEIYKKVKEKYIKKG